MKKILYILLFIACVSTYYGCNNEQELPGAIYGVVTDKATGEPIKSAGVELLPLGTKAITGDDGQFELQEVPVGQYTLNITKTGYTDITSSVINMTSGKTLQYDVQMEKLPPALRVLDDNGNDITNISYGEAEDDVARSFNIFNDSPEPLEWEIVTTAEWIKSVSKTEGELKAGGTQVVVVTINRNLLLSGTNKTTLHVISDNGSKQLTLNATNSKKLPTLNTLEATSVRQSSAIFNGTITNPGNPAYTERGFVYATTSMPTQETTIARLTFPVSKENKFAVTVTGLATGSTYFVRAYAKNSSGVAYSTNEVSFTPTTVLPDVMTERYSNQSVAGGTVTLNATIVDAGDPEYTERGFVYGLVHNPNIEDDTKKIAPGKGTGAYSVNLIGLEMGNIYYVRAYAINEQGTAYGDEITLDFNPVMPTVQTLAVSDITATSAKFNGDIIAKGDPAFTEKGFVYGTMPIPTLDDVSATSVVVSGTTTGQYIAAVSNLTTETTYYVRAYAKTETGIQYGEVKAFFPSAPAFVIIKELNLMVQTKDLGTFNWDDGDRACKNSIVGGYTDWRLPTLNELQGIYLLKEQIGGFSNGYYWSSYTHPYRGHYYIDFSSGYSSYDGGSKAVRAVRTYSPTAQIRFCKQDDYTDVTALGCLNEEADMLYSHEFGSASGTSSYYEMSPGKMKLVVYVLDDDTNSEGWYYVLDDPYYNFEAGNKYTYTFGDDGTYYTTTITLDGNMGQSAVKVKQWKTLKSSLKRLPKR